MKWTSTLGVEMHGAHRIVSMAQAARLGTLRALGTWRVWPPVKLWGLFARRFGYRGIALFLFALGFIGIGLGLPYAPAPPPQLFYSHFPIEVRVVLWAGSGAIGIIGAISRRPEWQDRGFAILLLPLFERLLANVFALVVQPDTLRWLSGCATWFLFSAIVTLIAAWPEPTSAPPATPPLLPDEV